MKLSLFFGIYFINIIHGKYLLVDVDDMRNHPTELNGNRCRWPPCYPPPQIDVEDTQNSPIKPNENRCRYPPCRPPPPMKHSTCISPGGRCSVTTKCCKGHICMDSDFVYYQGLTSVDWAKLIVKVRNRKNRWRIFQNV